MAPRSLVATALSLSPAFLIEHRKPETTRPSNLQHRKRANCQIIEDKNESTVEELTTPLYLDEHWHTRSNIRFVGIPFDSPKSTRPPEGFSPRSFTQKIRQSLGIGPNDDTDEAVDDTPQEIKSSTSESLPPTSMNPGDLVLSFRLFGTVKSQLTVLHLTDLENDADLFHALRYLYRKARGWRSLVCTIKEVNYVKFDLQGDRPTIAENPAIPPTHRSDYEYQPCPAPVLPPVMPELFAHMLKNPDCIEPGQDVVFRSLPKLTDANQSVEIASGSSYGPQEGWGLEMVDDVTLTTVFAVLACTIAVFGTTLIRVSWLERHDRSGDVEVLVDVIVPLLLVGMYFAWLLFFIRSVWGSDHPTIIAQKVDAHHIENNNYLAHFVRATRRVYAHWHNLLQLIGFWILALLPTSSFTFEGGRCQSCGIYSVKSTSHTVGHVPATTARLAQNSPSRIRNDTRDNDLSDVTDGGDGQSSHGGSSEIPQSNYEHLNSQHSNSDQYESGHEGGYDHDGRRFDDSEGSDLESADLYLHVLLSTGLRGKIQVPIKVTRFSNDYHLFVHLNSVYRKRRGRWKALWSVGSVRPVKYRLRDQSNVHTFYDPDDLASTMPDLYNKPPDYVFTYRPPEPVPDPPLLFAEELTHTFHHPGSRVWISSNAIVYSKEIYDRLPKRQGRLRCLVNDGFVYGYGIEFVESFNFKFFIYCELFILSCACVAEGLYAGIARGKTKSEVSLAIGALVLGFGQLLFAVILGLGEELEAWRY